MGTSLGLVAGTHLCIFVYIPPKLHLRGGVSVNRVL
jgi:hypothetical protein